MSDQAAVAAQHGRTKPTTRTHGFWRTYVFSTDHKVIGINAITGLLFLLFGFSLMMLMRWQLAYRAPRYR
jgi:cytochrome c oxidase subunit 1